jgi:hypothetical protein
MAAEQFFHEYNPGFYTAPAKQGNLAPGGFGTHHKPLCICGERFLAFAREYFPDLMADPTPQELEQALLTLTREYAHRKQFTPPNHHFLQRCLTDVFDELVLLINGKLEELNRLSHSSGGAHLFLGVDPTAEDDG